MANETEDKSSSMALMIISWLAVSLPLLWGVEQTFKKALALFS